MEVVFERTGSRRYAVAVRRPAAPVLRMDPAPGFDPLFPHDLQHLVVEEQLGLADGIYGRLARGGNASSFSITRAAGHRSKRAAARERRRLARREAALAASGGNDFARSERATFVAWHDWLAHSSDPKLWARASDMASGAASILGRMEADERSALLAALPRLRERIAEVTSEWSATALGGSMAITWSPLAREG